MKPIEEILDADRQRRAHEGTTDEIRNEALRAVVLDEPPPPKPEPSLAGPIPQRTRQSEALTAAPKHRPGRGSQLSGAEQREIRYMAALEGLSQAEIARRTGRHRETIAELLKGEAFDRVREDVDKLTKQEAIEKLRRLRMRAVNAWEASLDIAAAKGDHRAARDLLRSTDVIREPDEAGPKIVVQIGLEMPAPDQVEVLIPATSTLRPDPAGD